MKNIEQIMEVEKVKLIKELRNNQKDLEVKILEMSDQIPDFVNKFQDLEMSVEAKVDDYKNRDRNTRQLKQTIDYALYGD